jgi:hypothetical protein
MVDALIEYSDGRVGAMEVVGDQDADFLELWEVLRREGHQTDVPSLASGWSIWISHKVRFKRLLDDLPELLSTWDSAGLVDLARPHTAALEQLAAHGGAAERHVHIWTTIGTNYAVQSILELRDVVELLHSQAVRSLGKLITHVWIAGTRRTQGAVAWSRELGRVASESLPHLQSPASP